MNITELKAAIALQEDNVKTLEASRFVSASDHRLAFCKRRLFLLRDELARKVAQR